LVPGLRSGDQAMPSAASYPLFEGRQHSCRPNGGFGPGLLLPCLSDSFTRRLRPRDCRRWSSVRSRHHVSTFLHPLAPPALPGFIATMSALTPARGCACGLLDLAHIPCSTPRRSLHFTGLTFRALRLQSPHRSPDRFVTCPVSVGGFPFITGLGFTFPSEARQSARPNRVCATTDGPFASRCSPHHLTMTQLRSATERKQVSLKGTFTSLM
jgi:hypothetical protein